MSKFFNLLLTVVIFIMAAGLVYAGQDYTNVNLTANAEVGQTPFELTVTPSLGSGIGFGIVTGSLSDPRAQATNYITVNYWAGSHSTWYLTVATENDTGKTNDSGLFAEEAGVTNYMPLKVFTGNYGPAGLSANLPPYSGSEDDDYLFSKGVDIDGNGERTNTLTAGGSYSENNINGNQYDLNGDNDYADNWTAAASGTVTYGAGAQSITAPLVEIGVGWLPVWDRSWAEQVGGITKRNLCLKEGLDDSSLPSGFPTYFAVDLAGMDNDSYSTTVWFELNDDND